MKIWFILSIIKFDFESIFKSHFSLGYTHGTRAHTKHSLPGCPVPAYQLCIGMAFRMITLAAMWKAKRV